MCSPLFWAINVTYITCWWFGRNKRGKNMAASLLDDMSFHSTFWLILRKKRKVIEPPSIPKPLVAKSFNTQFLYYSAICTIPLPLEKALNKFNIFLPTFWLLFKLYLNLPIESWEPLKAEMLHCQIHHSLFH